MSDRPVSNAKHCHKSCRSTAHFFPTATASFFPSSPPSRLSCGFSPSRALVTMLPSPPRPTWKVGAAGGGVVGHVAGAATAGGVGGRLDGRRAEVERPRALALARGDVSWACQYRLWGE